MIRFFVLATALLAVSPALAQQVDPAFLQRALSALQMQRNQAADQAAVEKARADGLADDLAKAQAEIKSLQEKASEPKK